MDGENLEIRRTLTRYAAMMEQQREQLQERRENTLHFRGPGDGEPCEMELQPERKELRREVTLAHLDRLWREHLAFAAETREGIHLQGVARLDPLAVFQQAIIENWSERWKELDGAVARTLASIDDGSAPSLDETGLGAPTSTWTYLISDDPFRHQLMGQLAGTAAGLGLIQPLTFPLVLAWWIYTRFFWKGRRPRR